MRKHAALVIAIAFVAGFGCKKKKADEGGTAATGSGSAMAPAADASTGGMAAAPDAEAPKPPEKEIVVTMPADLKWIPFDEKAGEKGGAFAPVWGNPQEGPNGAIVKLPAGNPGVPHTHTGAYHGVSIAGGMIHQMDGKAKAKPLEPGSYWHIPGGAPHTSACPGKEDCLVMIHFNEGKMDLAMAKLDPKGKPPEGHVEKRPKDMKFAALDPSAGDKGPSIAVVWGDNQSAAHGTMWKLPAGMTSPAHTHTSDYHAVVVKGTVMNHTPDDKSPKEMGPGTYFMQPGGVAHITACKAGSECLMYSYMTGKFDFAMADAGGGAAPAGGEGSAAPAGGSAAEPADDTGM